MTKVTKKMVSDFLVNTKNELGWCVVSFNKETGKRDLAHGGFNFFNAFAVMTEQLHKGFDVILTDKSGWDYIGVFERENKTRISYKDLKPFEFFIDSYSYTIRK